MSNYGPARRRTSQLLICYLSGGHLQGHQSIKHVVVVAIHESDHFNEEFLIAVSLTTIDDVDVHIPRQGKTYTLVEVGRCRFISALIRPSLREGHLLPLRR